MTKREETKQYHKEILNIMRTEGLIIDEEEQQFMEQYLWSSLGKGVN